MSPEEESRAIDSETSSRSSSACICDEESAKDSLNSLIKGETRDKCNETCMDTDCSIDNHCPISCSEDSEHVSRKRKSLCCNPMSQTVWGVLLIIISLGGFIFRPLDFLLSEKLNMRPGLPPYEWWADPPDKVKMRAYVFNVTNHERFMQGLDAKINMQEIGPIVYLEKLLHYNISFNDNDTITYTAKRFLIYLPEENTIDLNQSIIVPNLAVLGMSSYLHDANYFLRTGLKFLLTSHPSEMFVKKTIYEFLWDFYEPILGTAKSVAPGLVPITNLGILSVIYNDFVDKVTVKIGPRWGHENFFKIDKVRGLPQVAGFDPDKCPDRLTGSTEGVMYHQHIKKHDVLLYLRKTVCKVVPLYFDKEITIDGIPIYQYNLSENMFDRVVNTTDCYATKARLPNGISDTSKCFFGFPLLASYPHFYTGSPPKDTYVTGLAPDRRIHNSYAHVEPITGIPFVSVARMQCNLQVHDLSSFNNADLNKFSNLVLPLNWIEYNQEGLPNYILNTVYFTVVILPPLSTILCSITLIMACYILSKQIFGDKIKKKSLGSIFKNGKADTLAKNSSIIFEKEIFLKPN